MAAKKYESMFERLIANSHKPEDQNENGCWPWAGVLGTRNYGIVSVRVLGRRTPRSVFAHRAMEQAFRNAEAQRVSDDAQPLWGPLPTVTAAPLHPDDETLDHLCYLRRCTHPDHWNVVSRAKNTALMQERKEASRRRNRLAHQDRNATAEVDGVTPRPATQPKATAMNLVHLSVKDSASRLDGSTIFRLDVVVTIEGKQNDMHRLTLIQGATNEEVARGLRDLADRLSPCAAK